MADWELQEKMHAGECLRFYEGLWPTTAAAAFLTLSFYLKSTKHKSK